MEVLVLPLSVTHQFEPTIGDDLIRTHVGRRPRATLNRAKHKLVVERARPQLFTHLVDDVSFLSGEHTDVFVCSGCGLLDTSNATNQVGIVGDGTSSNRKIH